MCSHKTFKNHSDKQEIVDQIKDIRKISLPPKDSVFVFYLLYFILLFFSSFFHFFFLCARYSFSSCISCVPFFYISLNFLIRFPKAIESIYLPIPVANIKHYYYYVHIQDSFTIRLVFNILNHGMESFSLPNKQLLLVVHPP